MAIPPLDRESLGQRIKEKQTSNLSYWELGFSSEEELLKRIESVVTQHGLGDSELWRDNAMDIIATKKLIEMKKADKAQGKKTVPRKEKTDKSKEQQEYLENFKSRFQACLRKFNVDLKGRNIDEFGPEQVLNGKQYNADLEINLEKIKILELLEQGFDLFGPRGMELLFGGRGAKANAVRKFKESLAERDRCHNQVAHDGWELLAKFNPPAFQ